MNDLIGNNYEPTEEQLKAKKWMKIIGVILIILVVVCIALVGLMYYIKATELKINIDREANTKLQDVLIFEDDKIYIPIRKFAEYVGYESYSGDYKQYAEDTTKCYVKSANEIASFTMNSDKIYKLLDDGSDYEYFTIDEPVKMIDGVLYTTIEGAEKAFNITFSYDKGENQITIYTLPYLVEYWASKFENSAIAGEGASFSNQKAILYSMIVVQNADNYYGVYDLSGKEILGTKYTSIEFIESAKEFIVTTEENKMGIMSYDATTVIGPEYDEIKQIDKDAGLYLVTNNNKQGVINHSGSIVIYPEYDQIGIDSSKYNSNNIKNQYLLYDNCIPVKRDNRWGIFDKNGKQILSVEYDDLGCSVGAGTSESQISTNNILLIPEYEGIVVEKDDLYGLMDSQGKELLPIALKSIYSTTTSGEETYYMIYNERVMNVIEYIKKYVKPETVDTTTNENSNTNNNTTNSGNEESTNTSSEQNSNNQTNNSVPTNANTVNENNITTQNNTSAQQ